MSCDGNLNVESALYDREDFTADPDASNSFEATSGVPLNHRKLLQLSHTEPNLLIDIEHEAQSLAASVDSLAENLCNLLQSISAITADNVEIHREIVCKLADGMDTNIKCMYTIMAKIEEISTVMKAAGVTCNKIREVKGMLELYDSIQ